MGGMATERQTRTPLPADAGRLVESALGLRQPTLLLRAIGRLHKTNHLAVAGVIAGRKELAPGNDDPGLALRECLRLAVPIPPAGIRAHALPQVQHVA